MRTEDPHLTQKTFDTPLYTIGTAARMLGISVHTIRMYEREGLILPYKKESHQRLFSDADIERLRCIRRAINEDKVSIEGIKHIQALIPCWAILPCSDEDKNRCAAYTSYDQPCWISYSKNTVCETLDCRTCNVYTQHANCHDVKQKLTRLL